ncbi:hypothetical protein BJ508DRAFT_417652, partial [Ascobolus immersus RN42]
MRARNHPKPLGIRRSIRPKPLGFDVRPKPLGFDVPPPHRVPSSQTTRNRRSNSLLALPRPFAPGIIPNHSDQTTRIRRS